jgi:hypothetical protein
LPPPKPKTPEELLVGGTTKDKSAEKPLEVPTEADADDIAEAFGKDAEMKNEEAKV